MDPQPQQPPAKPKFQLNKKVLWITGGVILSLLVVGGTYAFGRSVGKRTASVVTPTVTTPTPSPSAVTSATPVPTPAADAIVDTAKWLEKPEKLGNLKLFSKLKEEFIEESQVEFYKLGTDEGKDIILAKTPDVEPGPGGSINGILFLKTSSNLYELIAKHSTDVFSADNKYEGPTLASTIKINTDKLYKSIAPQKRLAVNKINLTDAGSLVFFSDIEASDITIKEYASTPYGKLYSITRKAEVGRVDSVYALKRPNNTGNLYQLSPQFIKDDGVAQITWNDGSKNSDPYRYDGTGGCGSATYISILESGSLDGLKAAGKTNENETIYEFTNPSNPVVDNYYKLMEGKYYDSSKNDYVAITVQDFLAKHGMFAYKDALNRVILFSSLVYGIQAECGKPVVYLYPTTETKVSVKVAADITVSDPAYNNGWNVTAQPNGKLINSDGNKYDSLFWEGLGHGIYPEIKEGFIVPKDKVEVTLKDHLKKLGLNEKESADFLEFWLPRMPNTPYTRLTWFGTRQMNTLAPLAIEPKPDSVIRIFLDFEGLQKPITLPTQRLGAIERKGFTAIEWGGLLRK